MVNFLKFNNKTENTKIFQKQNNPDDYQIIKELLSVKESDTNKIAVRVVRTNKEKYIDIRTMYRHDKDSQWTYTSKGIMLDFEMFQLLMNQTDRIVELLD